MTMSAHTDLQLALRAKLLSLLVCTTGSTSLTATATGYARASGSFVADGFCAGMEVTPTGFASNVIGTITEMTATMLFINGGRTAESVASGRTLSVLLPSQRAWESVKLKPIAGAPYVEEQYIPGPKHLDSVGPGGLITLEPMYSPRIYAPANTGISADGRYADAIEALFAPKTPMALANGDILYVRSSPSVFRGQRAPSAKPGWSCVPVTIPCRCQTTNTI